MRRSSTGGTDGMACCERTDAGSADRACNEAVGLGPDRRVPRRHAEDDCPGARDNLCAGDGIFGNQRPRGIPPVGLIAIGCQQARAAWAQGSLGGKARGGPFQGDWIDKPAQKLQKSIFHHHPHYWVNFETKRSCSYWIEPIFSWESRLQCWARATSFSAGLGPRPGGCGRAAGPGPAAWAFAPWGSPAFGPWGPARSSGRRGRPSTAFHRCAWRG
jgi:hypothetical protein